MTRRTGTLVQLNGYDSVQRINPAHVVRLVVQDDDLTTIHFAGDSWVTVRHNVDDVVGRLGFSEVTL